ncbi:MAG: hypothetical protein DWQ31_19030 [Planctomycetota bacterium]|nr:MAG: hypothetical protein DWQ31_19030 [Planctomycetota bacterium]REJ93180.1 MAG: hypothetical protein DWQ35_10910 [Planctomycetota bacterium]REK23365.1 MAG: hypothetical protein DWQ42_15495 [Planctomycetota bacterium]REK47168.1 MAG: hypothetical protein DWQ46_04875 [Planctomycetota bacterium]
MAWEFACINCRRPLQVPNEQAGAQIRCPYCRTVFTVPDDAMPTIEPVPPPAPSGSTLSGSARSGSAPSRHFPSAPGGGPPGFSGPPSSAPGNAPSGYSAPGTVNPYQTPRIGVGIGAQRSHLPPHRGALVLTLGILSLAGTLVCGIFVFLGIPAWIMGRNDLHEMRAGRLDPSGEGITQAGMILGIIATSLLGLGLLLLMLAFVVPLLIAILAN